MPFAMLGLAWYKSGGKKERTPTKRRTSTPTEARPQKRVATEERVVPRDDKSSAPSPPPSEAKANYPVLSAEIGVKSVHTVSDYRVQDREEQYLITGKIGSAGPLENWWIRLENVAGNQSAISKLKNYRKNYIYRNNAARKAEAQDLQEDDADEDEDQEYEVECLLDVRVVGKKEEFLVKWKDYPPAENTWEPIANLTGVEASELEQCRQKQAYLIVPKSSRSAPSGKVEVNAEPSKSIAEGQAAHTKDFAGETSGTAAKAGSADEAQQSAAAAVAEEEGPSGVGEVVGAFEEVSYQPHGQEQVDLPPTGDTRPPVDDAIMGEMVGSDGGAAEDDGDVIFEDVVVDEGPHEGVLVFLNLSSVFVWASTAPVEDLSDDDDSTPTLIARQNAPPAEPPVSRSAACLAVVACLSQYVTFLDGLVADGRWAPFYLAAVYSIGVLMIIFLKPSSGGGLGALRESGPRSCFSLLGVCFLWSVLVGIVDPSRPRTVTEIDPSVDVAVPPPVLLLLGILCAAGGASVRFPVPVFLTRIFSSVPASSMQTIVTNASTLGCFLLLKSVYDRHSLGPVTLLLLRKLMGPFCNAMASLHGVCEDLHVLVKSSGGRKKWKIPTVVMLGHIFTAVLFIGRDAELSEIWKYSSRIYHMAVENVDWDVVRQNEEVAKSIISDAKIEKSLETMEATGDVKVGAIVSENITRVAEVTPHDGDKKVNADLK
ncbi:hypothetical protein FOZ60_014979 [Perkinsus olseni]|uniref:Chromo domain-containing protein n=2 Tax=Perkinsus olseni TaxID=32597 RepID=A0A7J6N6E7_PEROL|nr:hypothetical protein FOZ60_014979 [Perkinsus olseni]